MTEILLARHGETDWNIGRRVQGHTDIPLNAAGVDQARVLAEQLAAEPLTAVFSSDLSRALDTATAVAHAHGLEVTVDPRLREKNFGPGKADGRRDRRAVPGRSAASGGTARRPRRSPSA